MGERDPSFTVGGIENWSSHFGNLKSVENVQSTLRHRHTPWHMPKEANILPTSQTRAQHVHG